MLFCDHCNKLVSRRSWYRHQPEGDMGMNPPEEILTREEEKLMKLLYIKISMNVSTRAFDAMAQVLGIGSFHVLSNTYLQRAKPRKVCHLHEGACRCRKAVHIPLESRLQSLYADPVLSRLIRFPWAGRGDIWQSKRGKAARLAANEGDLFIVLSSDAFGISERTRESVCAVVANIASYPSWIRAKASHQWLTLLTPTSSPEPHVHLVVDELVKLATEGVLIAYDAATGERDVKRKCHLLYTVNDLRAIPKVSGQKQTPALHGACNGCSTVGLRVGFRTVYPGACSFLNVDHPLRAAYVKKMPATLRDYGTTAKPKTKTQARVDLELKNLGSAECQYNFEDQFKRIPGWQTSFHTNDVAHLVVNFMKLLFGCMLGQNKQEYNLERHRAERALGRFAELSVLDDHKALVDVVKPPWQLNAADIEKVTTLLASVSSIHPQVPDLSKRFSSLKFADWLLLAGNVS